VSAPARSRACIACLACIALALLVAPLAKATPLPKHNPPKSIYLALGDSLAFGYQQAKFIQNLPTDDFANALRSIDPKIQDCQPWLPG
jgi:hypothetical protein